ncbi:hypothetical protein FVEG_16427 [Fusarium verticillioides 7600]|uniref:Uncharacterized protein n=1 Tax=Gibberella moniliformis (strain M3125 / FGSC 7600) TaxID=334819 RepID=W7MMZ2_GIBM7|nr:hypothetical protein FVEG_16427 [Fusarium verticillioides 7600]EWG49174.1 hypothetical protein FVEG_16427 [Fusarium verticillioides 7600]
MGIYAAACTFEGRDAIWQECAKSLREGEERLGLCGDQADGLLTTATLSPNSPEWVRATSQLAWGIYSWLTINVIYYNHKHVRFPPALPIPGQDENWPGPPPYLLGKAFPHTCGLWMIAPEVLGVYSFSDWRVDERVPLEFAEGEHKKLLVWANTLGADMVRLDGCLPEVMVFQYILPRDL